MTTNAKTGLEIPFKRNMYLEAGWTLTEEGPPHPEWLTPDRVAPINAMRGRKIVSFERPYIPAEEMRYRAVANDANYGQHTAEYIFEHRDKIFNIPPGIFVIFPATVWKGEENGKTEFYYPFLCCVEKEWFLRFYTFSEYIGFMDRFLQICSGSSQLLTEV